MISPHLIDVVLVFTAIEGIALVRWRISRRSGLAPSAVALLLLPGIFLMVGLRAALAGAVWPWVPAALLGALLTHLADLHHRWRR